MRKKLCIVLCIVGLIGLSLPWGSGCSNPVTEPTKEQPGTEQANDTTPADQNDGGPQDLPGRDVGMPDEPMVVDEQPIERREAVTPDKTVTPDEAVTPDENTDKGQPEIPGDTPATAALILAQGTGASARGIAEDAAGNIYIAGSISSAGEFGTTKLTSKGSGDVLVAKLDKDGNWLWAKNAGGTGSDSAYAIALDSDNNILIVGGLRDTAEFGTTKLTSKGSDDIFVAKLDKDGNWLWAKRAGSTGTLERGYGVTADSSNNVIIVGDFKETADFGSTNLTSKGSSDLFVAKLDKDGNWLWAKNAGSTTGDSAEAVVTDSTDNIYIGGRITGSATLGTTTLTSKGSDDLFVAKLDKDGNWGWAKATGDISRDSVQAMAIDGKGDIAVSGYIIGNVPFGSTTLNGKGKNDAFVAKIDASGNWKWARQAGGTSTDYAYGVAADANGNVFFVGTFQDTADFGSTKLTSKGSRDVFVAKLDATGNWVWAKRAGGTSVDYAYGASTDANGNVTLTGMFLDTADFDGTNLTAKGTIDIFVWKLK